jgi:hypothetical protein
MLGLRMDRQLPLDCQQAPHDVVEPQTQLSQG